MMDNKRARGIMVVSEEDDLGNRYSVPNAFFPGVSNEVRRKVKQS